MRLLIYGAGVIGCLYAALFSIAGYDVTLYARGKRLDQVHTALKELSLNIGPNIITMVNTLEPYSNWEELCGKGRIIPAFPGAGGSFDNGILKAALTPRIVQPTTFSEIDGSKTKCLLKLAEL